MTRWVALGAVFLFFPVFLLLILLGASGAPEPQQQECATTQTPVTAVGAIPQRLGPYGHTQLRNASEIMRAGADLKLSRRDQTIGVMTAIGESTLRVLNHGDKAGPDSRGLFQQRANGAWGSYADRMNPYRSALSFFRVLAKVKDRAKMTPTLVAHRVQRNKNPNHYTRFWDDAQRIVTALSKKAQAPEASAPSSARYDLKRVRPHVAAAANLLGRKFAIKTIGGWRLGNTYDYTGHPAGLAIDLMVPLTQAGQRTGTQLAAYAQQQAGPLAIKYIIWNQRIWSVDRAGQGWRPMRDRGSKSANHIDHVHISFKETPHGNQPQPAVTDPCVTAKPKDHDPGPVAVPPGKWVAPADVMTVSSRFGMRRHPVTGAWKLHSGTDYPAGGCGAPIRSAANGIVISAKSAGGYGHLITVDHGKAIVTRYAHMTSSGILVRQGQRVNAGQMIARVGSSGYSTACHLHFEVRINGKFTDPARFLAQRGVGKAT